MEIGFRVTIIKMIKELRRGKDSLSEVRSFFYKELENIRNNQTQLKNTIIETKNTLEGINGRLNGTEDWISELEDRIVEITVTEQEKEKRMKRNEDNLRDLWENIK